MHFRQIIFGILITVISVGQGVDAQPVDPNHYVPLNNKSDWTSSNAHSHNDYLQRFPFSSAYAAGFGSMEADIFLFHDSLFVGHVKKDILLGRTLQALYLDSIAYYIKKNRGFPYPLNSKRLQLLIDIKSEPNATIAAFIAALQKYPALIQSHNLSFVITGNRPSSSSWFSYPDFIYFDGEIGKSYDPVGMPKIAMMSGNLADFSSWNGTLAMDSPSLEKLKGLIRMAHGQGKKVRFWNAPDFPEAWNILIQIGVDWINTDHISGLEEFLQNQ